MTREEKRKAIDTLEKSVPVIAMTQEEFNDYIQTVNQIMGWLEQEPCEDAISRQEAIDVLTKTGGIRGDALKVLYDLPSVTPQQKIGHWIYFKAVNTSEIIWSECSECKDGERGCAKRMKYCPNCGAKMQEVEE